MTRKACGRKRKHQATGAQRFNWIHPIVFQQIDNAAREVGPLMLPKSIVTLLHARNSQQFSRLTPQVLGRWIERPKNAAPRWKEKVLKRVQMGNKPHGLVTRSGILVCIFHYLSRFHSSYERCIFVQSLFPEVVQAIIEYLQYLRTAGVPVDINTIRAIMLAMIQHHAPHLFQATVGADKRPFLCSETFVRRFIYEHLRWVPRMSTRAAQKTPVDAEQQIYELFLRLALLVRDAGIRHPSLIDNFDQTQVVMANNDARTLDIEGSKQVGVVGKEEKRAFTAVVGVSASGDVLPTQLVFKGGSDRSLPTRNAPGREDASQLGMIYSWNPATYWSDLSSMKVFFEKIIVPYFMRQKELLHYPEDQECVVLLDCWSVHRGKEFRRLVHQNWPWLRLRYIPGGTTGLAQPCDVGIQRPYKLSIKRSQLQDVVSETLTHLKADDDPSSLKLDSRIGTLRDRAVAWTVKAWKDINHPEQDPCL